MTAWQAIEKVLREAAPSSMHYEEITRNILKKGFWETRGKTPERTINERLNARIRLDGENCPWRQTGPGLYVWRAETPNKASSTDKISDAIERPRVVIRRRTPLGRQQVDQVIRESATSSVEESSDTSADSLLERMKNRRRMI